MNNEGVISFDFIPQIKDNIGRMHADFEKRKSFAININDIGNFLEIEEFNDQGFTLSLEYSVKKGFETKRLRLEKNIKDDPESITISLEVQLKIYDSPRA